MFISIHQPTRRHIPKVPRSLCTCTFISTEFGTPWLNPIQCQYSRSAIRDIKTTMYADGQTYTTMYADGQTYTAFHSLTTSQTIHAVTHILARRFLLSKCHKFSRYTCKCNFSYANKKSKAFIMPIFMKVANPEQQCVTCCTKFHKNRAIGVDSVDVNSLSTQNKVCFSLCRFSWNSRSRKKVL